MHAYIYAYNHVRMRTNYNHVRKTHTTSPIANTRGQKARSWALGRPVCVCAHQADRAPRSRLTHLDDTALDVGADAAPALTADAFSARSAHWQRWLGGGGRLLGGRHCVGRRYVVNVQQRLALRGAAADGRLRRFYTGTSQVYRFRRSDRVLRRSQLARREPPLVLLNLRP